MPASSGALVVVVVHSITDDLRITGQRALLAPAILFEELPADEAVQRFVAQSRRTTEAILTGADDRLLVVVGPCSVHDPEAALDYARQLQPVAARLAPELFVVMRVYFEKPRTIGGWKGLINDPDLDGSFKINKGLRLARRLLLDVTRTGLPAGTEFLDTIFGQYFADLVTWGGIGARTTESQVHRELASGLSMPVGFKNRTDGDVQVAIDALRAARLPHWFPSLTKEGAPAILSTSGNPHAHLVLRGGARSGPNFGIAAVTAALTALTSAGLPPAVMIDCSHGNSGKDPAKQPQVAAALAEQIAAGQRGIVGAMLESHLVGGRQELGPLSALAYGKSVTDGCLSFADTLPVLDTLAAAVRQRRRVS
ncbi:MAG TPA: 3-deoxy-7-phosphoheptulonate synthase [Opitutaceae bacterium]|nr:3-deoxy-7-phosphoheptulonate synthase [Opitutaceae bacterium]